MKPFLESALRAGRPRPLLAASLVLVMACSGPRVTSSPTDSAEPVPSPSAALESSPSPTPGATAVAVATPAPTASPEAVATDPAVACGAFKPYTGPWPTKPLLPGSAVHVAVTELNLRDGPCTSARKAGTLKKGRLMLVSDSFGPIKANGYAWYSVFFPPNAPNELLPTLPERWFPDGTDTEFAWMAVTDGSKDYVTPLTARCPATVDLENVQAMLPFEWLACFDAPIVVQGTFGCGGCGGEGALIAEPRWLADAFEFDQLHLRWADGWEFVSLPIHFKPDGPAKPAEGSIVRVQIHVDDPAATQCRVTWTNSDPSFTVAREFAVNWCRERFVVDSYTVIGTDPDYEG